MSQFASASASPPSLSDLLHTLRIHLGGSSVRLSNLPTILQIFAHFELLSRSIKSQAGRALEEHWRRKSDLLVSGVDEQDFEQYGCLSVEEEKQIAGFASRDEDGVMSKLSMMFRRHVRPSQPHMAFWLTREAYRSTLESASAGPAQNQDRHRGLLSRPRDRQRAAMGEERLPAYPAYDGTAGCRVAAFPARSPGVGGDSRASKGVSRFLRSVRWCCALIEGSRGDPHPTFQDLTGVKADQATKRTAKFASKLLEEAESTVRDAVAFEAIFDTNDEEEQDEVKQEEAEDNLLDAPALALFEAVTADTGVATIERRRVRSGLTGQEGGSDWHRQPFLRKDRIPKMASTTRSKSKDPLEHPCQLRARVGQRPRRWTPPRDESGGTRPQPAPPMSSGKDILTSWTVDGRTRNHAHPACHHRRVQTTRHQSLRRGRGPPKNSFGHSTRRRFIANSQGAKEGSTSGPAAGWRPRTRGESCTISQSAAG